MTPHVTCAAALLIPLLASAPGAGAEDGYELWLRYRPVSDPVMRKSYGASITGVSLEGSSPTLRAARDEIARGLRGLLGVDVPFVPPTARDGLLVAGTPARSSLVAARGPRGGPRAHGRGGLRDPLDAGSQESAPR